MDAQGRTDVYGMLVSGFSQPAVAVAYVVAMVLLGIHLWHATASFFQTMGWDQPAIRRLVGWAAPTLAFLIAAGYIVIPLAVWSGIVS